VGFKSHVTQVYLGFRLNLDLCLLYKRFFFVNILIYPTHKYKIVINFFHNNFSTKKISNLKLKLLGLILVLKLILIITRINFILVLDLKSSLKEGQRRVFLVGFSTLFLDALLHFWATKYYLLLVIVLSSSWI